MSLDYFITVYHSVTLLGQKLVEIQNVVKKTYPNADVKKDARITAFAKCNNVTVSTSLALGLFMKNLLDDNWWRIEITSVKEDLPLPTEDINIIRNQFQQFIKLGFVHFFYFAIESSLRTFNKAVDPKFKDENFKNVYDNLLNKLHLGKYRCLLDLLRLLRNTLHSNGYHNAKDEIITYKGKTYPFKRGKRVDYFEWQFLVGLMHDATQMLVDVVKSAKVATHEQLDDPYIIEDNFVASS